MLLLLPFIVIGLGFSLGFCSAAGYTGALLVVMLLLLFLAGVIAAFVLFVLLLTVISLFVDRKKPQRAPAPFYAAVVRYVMGLLTVVFRVRVHLRGAERLPAGRWLLVGNHRSGFDPIVTGWSLRERRMVFISKPENMRIPMVGAFLHKAAFLAIDRENDRAALRTILAAAELLRSGACSVGVYPEGTRNHGEGLLPFRNGVFKIAQKARVPIVVVAIRGTDRILKNFPLHATDVELEICGVIDPETLAQHKTNEIGEMVRACISSASI